MCFVPNLENNLALSRESEVYFLLQKHVHLPRKHFGFVISHLVHPFFVLNVAQEVQLIP